MGHKIKKKRRTIAVEKVWRGEIGV